MCLAWPKATQLSTPGLPELGQAGPLRQLRRAQSPAWTPTKPGAPGSSHGLHQVLTRHVKGSYSKTFLITGGPVSRWVQAQSIIQWCINVFPGHQEWQGKAIHKMPILHPDTSEYHQQLTIPPLCQMWPTALISMIFTCLIPLAMKILSCLCVCNVWTHTWLISTSEKALMYASSSSCLHWHVWWGCPMPLQSKCRHCPRNEGHSW